MFENAQNVLGRISVQYVVRSEFTPMKPYYTVPERKN